MLLEKLFQIIDRSVIGSAIEKRFEIISQTDPERIYIEQVRSFLGLNAWLATLLCEMAVKDRLFKKRYAIECPKCRRVIKSVKHKSELPSIVTCDTCQLLEKEKCEYLKDEILLIPFYQLNAGIK